MIATATDTVSTVTPTRSIWLRTASTKDHSYLQSISGRSAVDSPSNLLWLGWLLSNHIIIFVLEPLCLPCCVCHRRHRHRNQILYPLLLNDDRNSVEELKYKKQSWKKVE